MNFRRLKLIFAAAGIVLSVVAIALDDTRVTWAAIALLVAALSMRILDRRGRPE